jgi:anthraniloyl-CoA monooxygenase
MRVVCVGGGPGGLFLSILLKRADPDCRITVHERHRRDDPYGFGVVFSDATGHNLAQADPETFRAMAPHFHHWDDIHIHYRDTMISTSGHGFSGISRRVLLQVLAERAAELGVDLRFESEVGIGGGNLRGLLEEADLIVAADGANSAFRERFRAHFEPVVDVRPNRFVWLGTDRPFPAFYFDFKENEHGLWRVHAYQYASDPVLSTFIVEATDETWEAAGLAEEDEEATLAFCEELFRAELRGHRLISNRSVWRRFPVLANERWSVAVDRETGKVIGLPGGAGDRRTGTAAGQGYGDDAIHVVLLGDAAHTAHFSIGSGTKLAMEDAISLAGALAGTGASLPEAKDEGLPSPAGAEPTEPPPSASPARPPGGIGRALAAYEEARRPDVESLQRAGRVSMQWFEETERYTYMEPIQFAFNLLTRSMRVTHEDLKLRDPDFVPEVDAWFAEHVAAETGVSVPQDPPPPPLFTPFRVRELVLENRVVVSPMCMYSAVDGTPNDWHLVHLGSRAVGGAGLVMVEMTNVSREARISPGCTGLYKDEHVDGWRRIVEFVHTRSYAKIGIQLGHAGRKGATKTLWEGDNEPLEEGAWPIVSASPLPYFPHSQVPREMDREDMDRVLAHYERAAAMAEAGGFDWLELHCAHGYLLASFVSPLTNVRTDEYGGSLENRLRYPLEVFRAVRAVWPDHKPMSVRISAVDWVPGGIDSEEAVQVARAFREAGCDLIDVSAGQTVPEQQPLHGRLFQTPFSDRIRHEADVPTMAVGNISSFTDVNTILAAGRADLCLMARAHLWDPYWTRHAAYELDHALEWPPQYATLNSYRPRFK